MNELPIVYGLIGASIVIFCYLVVQIGRLIGMTVRHNRNIKKFPNVFPLDKSKMCAGRHSWYLTVLAFLKIPVKEYLVCTDCGFVSGTEFQLNTAAITAIHEAKEKQETRDKQEEAIKIRIREELELARTKSTNENIKRLIDISDRAESSDKSFKAVVVLLDGVFNNAVHVQHQITQELKREINGKNGSN